MAMEYDCSSRSFQQWPSVPVSTGMVAGGNSQLQSLQRDPSLTLERHHTLRHGLCKSNLIYSPQYAHICTHDILCNMYMYAYIYIYNIIGVHTYAYRSVQIHLLNSMRRTTYPLSLACFRCRSLCWSGPATPGDTGRPVVPCRLVVDLSDLSFYVLFWSVVLKCSLNYKWPIIFGYVIPA